MAVHFSQRRFNKAQIEAELAGKTQYLGKPCEADPGHVRSDGTSLRDTIRNRCVRCTEQRSQKTNQKRRQDYAEAKGPT